MKTIKALVIFCFTLLMIPNQSNAQKKGFVYAEGSEFMLNGKPFYFSGTNVYDFFTYGASHGDPETTYMDKGRIDTHMRKLYQNGIRVVRLWGFSHEDWHGFETAKGVYNEPQFKLFDYIVKSAEANGIKLIVALENYWNDYGGIKDRLKWEGIDVEGAGIHDQGQFFTNRSAIDGYKDYVKFFITRVNHYDNVAYKDDPTIMAWELMNEPRYQGFGDDLSSEVLRGWVDEMGAFIKDLDPDHMLSSGLEGHGAKYGFGGDEGNDFIKIHESPYMDFTSAHPYVRESWSNFTPEQTKTLVCTWADEAHDILKKPLYIGEFNVERNERIEWWEEFYELIEEKEIGGTGFWWFPDANGQRDKFAVFEGDEELAYYKKHARKTQTQAGGEIIYTAILYPRSGDQFVTGSDVLIQSNLLNEENTINKVDFYGDGVLLGTDTVAPYSYNWENLDAGIHEITSVVTDVNGNSITSLIRKIEVSTEVLLVEYKDASSGAISNVIKPHFNLINNSSRNISYADLSIRYWFTKEGTEELNFFSEYSRIGGSNVMGNFVNVSDDMYYVEVTFKPETGMLIQKSSSDRIETKIAKVNYSDMDQSNDYSYNPANTDFGPSSTITLYLNGKLVSGTEPGGSDTPKAVIAATPKSGVVPLPVTFDATGSSDPNSDTLTYTWDFGDGFEGVGTTANHEYTVVGNYTATLTVNDGNGNTDKASMMISVLAPNSAPVAAFEAAVDGFKVVFDATSSTDPDGDTLSYSWNFGDGTTGSASAISHVYTGIGNYEVTLIVNDGNGNSDTITKTISVQEIIVNRAPIAAFTFDNGRCGGPIVEFDATGSSDPDGDSLSYVWDFGDGTSGEGINVTHGYADVKDFTVMLTVSDGKLNSTKTSFVVIILPTPCAPPIGFVSIFPSVTSGVAPLAVVFNGIVETPLPEDQVAYSWFFENGGTGDQKEESYIFNTPGTYLVSLSAEAEGLTKEASVEITVTPPVIIDPSGDLSIEYKAMNRSATDNTIAPHLKIINDGTSAIPYAELSIRYWFTSEDNSNLNFWCDWSQLGNTNVIGSFGSAKGMDYLEITFADIAGSLAANNNSGDIQGRLAKTNWSSFNENDDYSYDDSKTSFARHDKVTLYQNGMLVWGIEPNNSGAKTSLTTTIFSMVPNPATDKVNIRSSVDLNGGLLSIYDISGKEIRTKLIQSESTTVNLDISALGSGLYLVRILNSDGSNSIEKLIVK